MKGGTKAILKLEKTRGRPNKGCVDLLVVTLNFICTILLKAVQDYNVYVAFHAGIDTGRTFNLIKFVEVSF